ncbi:hypothetical protein JAAARDRAFT_79651 [Jaapia argillacea MUCL 33604]|uniref:Uncharacterized protein n=1 Tax=Jaapia argillacea MUCL 33604 TaxID=933084 RepID=A0A067PL83_9AGAM|nr:hypothetical protein JAAARDRAFT_79651 [Jaapia argillacea MUCL 33604]
MDLSDKEADVCDLGAGNNTSLMATLGENQTHTYTTADDDRRDQREATLVKNPDAKFGYHISKLKRVVLWTARRLRKLERSRLLEGEELNEHKNREPRRQQLGPTKFAECIEVVSTSDGGDWTNYPSGSEVHEDLPPAINGRRTSNQDLPMYSGTPTSTLEGPYPHRRMKFEKADKDLEYSENRTHQFGVEKTLHGCLLLEVSQLTHLLPGPSLRPEDAKMDGNHRGMKQNQRLDEEQEGKRRHRYI